jgi:hypothetical protein
MVGPHLGVLNKTKGLGIPPRLADLVQQQLELRVIQELELFKSRFKTTSKKIPELPTSSTFGSSSEGVVGSSRILREISEEVIGSLDHGVYEGESRGLAALLDLREISLPVERDLVPDSISTPQPTLSLPMIQTSGTDRQVPLYSLTTLIPVSLRSQAILHLENLLFTEHLQSARLRAVKEGTYNPGIPFDIPKGPLPPVMGIYTFPTDRGVTPVPLLIALWRLRAWHGYGWEEGQVNGKGRRVS